MWSRSLPFVLLVLFAAIFPTLVVAQGAPAPSDDLPALIRDAKKDFRAVTPADLAAAKQDLAAAVDRLDARLVPTDAQSAPWREFLKLQDLREQLAQEKPDPAALQAVHARFASGNNGLGLVWFIDVRQQLRRYLVLTAALGNPKLNEQYQTLLDALAGRVEAYRKAPDADLAAQIALDLNWLRETGQAPAVLSAVQGRLSRPNVAVNMSERVVASRLDRPVDDTSPVQDCILGTTIYGTARTIGQVRGVLPTAPDQGAIDAVFQGVAHTSTIGYNGPVTITSSGATSIGATKRIVVTAEGILGLPAGSCAATNTQICDIDAGGRRLVEHIAWKRAGKQLGQAEAIASQHAQQRFNERMDREAVPAIAQADANFQKKFRTPLSERKLFPELFQAGSSPDSLQITLMALGGNGLGAPNDMPAAIAGSDFTVRAHESSINNLTGSALGSMKLDEQGFSDIVTRFLNLPPKVGTEQDNPENWEITFAPAQPITVRFENNEYTITIRGTQYRNKGEAPRPAMNVTARYKIEQTPRGLVAKRQGPLQIVPPRGGQLSGPEIGLRNTLNERFQKFFEEEMAPKNLVLGPDTPNPIELRLTRWETAAGWLIMAWEKVPEKK